MVHSGGPAHVTSSVVSVATEMPGWVTLVRANNPSVMTLDGTNSWVLKPPDAGSALVVDPGPLEPPHLEAIMQAAGAPIEAILVTHGHDDHVGGLAEFQAMSGAPVIDATRPDGAMTLAGLQVRLLHTPGHTKDSVCYQVIGPDGSTAICTGDTILGRGTTVVAWPDGDLGDYLTSLRHLVESGPQLALTGHGPALSDCGAAAAFYLDHRLARLEQVRAAVAGGATTADDVVALVYADVDHSLWPAAAWSVRAQLAYLRDRESIPGAGRLGQP